MTVGTLGTVAVDARRRWVGACALAETIGMTAAAAASLAARSVGPGAAALAIVVAGGLGEGTALGILQGRVLARRWGRAVLPGWLGVTLVVAGLGWAAASAPSALSTEEGGTAPAWGLVIAGAVALGAALGALLGLCQAAVLRGTTAVPRPRRWIGTSALGWSGAMPIIFLGASIPDEGWTSVAILAMGPPTGLLAGCVLGLVTSSVVAPG